MSERILRIAAGSYERILLGFAYGLESKTSEQVFKVPIHVGCVRCCSIVSKKGSSMIVTGGEDEKIKIFSLSSLEECGELVAHDGPVTCLGFHSSQSMVSGDSEGAICIWRTSDWTMLKKLKEHKGAVVALDVHPSGRLALSLGSNNTLICWNLLNGTMATKRRLLENASLVLFSPNGDRHLILYSNSLSLFSTNKDYESSESSVKFTVKSNCAVFVDDFTIAVGFEDGSVGIYSCENNMVLSEISQNSLISRPSEQSSDRIRAISVTKSDDTHYLCAASSNGKIKVWQISNKMCVESEPMCVIESKARITSVAIDLVYGYKTE